MFFKRLSKGYLIFVSIFLISSFATPFFVLAQVLTPDQRAALQSEYDQTMREINDLQNTIDGLRQQQKTIKGDISLLTAQINQAEAVLKQKNIIIKQLTTQINAKTQRINSLNERIEQGKDTLAELMRKTYEIDNYSLPEAVFSGKNFTEFFGDLDTFNSIQKSMQDLFYAIRSAKAETEKEKQALAEQKNQQVDAKYVIEQTKKAVTKNQTEKKQLLAINQNQESSYNKVLADKQQRADKIRAALFNLRDTQGISFDVALTYANNAASKTGVRSALILAILSQESDLGKNQGSCYVRDLVSGDGVGKNTGTNFEKVMKSPRDTDAFNQITSSLGMQWATTAVSCPLGTTYSSSRGYGGAMGPSQFIPSTWLLPAFKNPLSQIFGVSMPNPWDPAVAIMATAIYLQNLGAAGGGYSAERNAACMYYSGRKCDSKRPINYTYGNSVLQKAETIQGNIDFLKSV